MACRSAYNKQIPYHNFRHVVDVLQAVFYFLVQLGALPPYTSCASPEKPPDHEKSLSKLLTPCDALTLLVVAIGHDVGHPGVNNAFLVTLKAPLAQVYNDRSVLESFHCAAFSQVLRKHWPKTLEMRKMMIDMILATDMGLHFDYMGKLEKLRKKLEKDGGYHRWEGKTVAEYRSLICALLIKCADISNVVRQIPSGGTRGRRKVHMLISNRPETTSVPHSGQRFLLMSSRDKPTWSRTSVSLRRWLHPLSLGPYWHSPSRKSASWGSSQSRFSKTSPPCCPRWSLVCENLQQTGKPGVGRSKRTKINRRTTPLRLRYLQRHRNMRRGRGPTRSGD